MKSVATALRHVGKVSEVPRKPHTFTSGRNKGLTLYPTDYVAGCTCGWHGEPRSMVRQARADRDAHLKETK